MRERKGPVCDSPTIRAIKLTWIVLTYETLKLGYFRVSNR